nr:tetratricopeptide repeat protein [Chitinophagaceae bacterium]
MKYFLSFLLLLVLLVFSFSQQTPAPETDFMTIYLSAEKEFRDAEKLSLQKNYSEEKEAEMNRSALKKLLQVISRLEAGQLDSLAFHGHYMIGSLYHYFDSLNLARQHYQRSIQFQQQAPVLRDSVLFKPLLFIGSIYYSQHAFDSAVIFYKKAEAITEQYSQPLAEEQRLYNRLGVIQYETGNYKQAKNYFEKALSLLPISDPLYKEFKANYQNNIASALLNLEKYDKAKSIYLQLLPLEFYKNEVTQNLGLIDL